MINENLLQVRDEGDETKPPAFDKTAALGALFGFLASTLLAGLMTHKSPSDREAQFRRQQSLAQQIQTINYDVAPDTGLVTVHNATAAALENFLECHDSLTVRQPVDDNTKKIAACLRRKMDDLRSPVPPFSIDSFAKGATFGFVIGGPVASIIFLEGSKFLRRRRKNKSRQRTNNLG